jgi:hypothetical protein
MKTNSSSPHLRHTSHMACSCSCRTLLGHALATADAHANRYEAAAGADSSRRDSTCKNDDSASSGHGSAKMARTAMDTVPPPELIHVTIWRGVISGAGPLLPLGSWLNHSSASSALPRWCAAKPAASKQQGQTE